MAGDFDRALAEKGRRDMVPVARRVAALSPDLALVSPARRTRETWDLCGLPEVPVRFEEAIYEAGLGTLVGLVQDLPDEAALPILVGHNPGLEDFADLLATGGERRSGLPPGGLVLAEWPAGQWRDVRPGDGRLVEVATPASLAASRHD